MKNPFTWVIFLLVTVTIVTCTPDDDSRVPQNVAAPVEGFYMDTVTFQQIRPWIIDSVITKEVVKRNDSTYIICPGVCSYWWGNLTDSILFTIHPDNTISPEVIFNPFPPSPPRINYYLPLPSYYVPTSGYIYIQFYYFRDGTDLIERLKKI